MNLPQPPVEEAQTSSSLSFPPTTFTELQTPIPDHTADTSTESSYLNNSIFTIYNTPGDSIDQPSPASSIHPTILTTPQKGNREEGDHIIMVQHKTQPHSFLGVPLRHTIEDHTQNNIPLLITHYYTPLNRKRKNIPEEEGAKKKHFASSTTPCWSFRASDLWFFVLSVTILKPFSQQTILCLRKGYWLSRNA